jgi:ankyrin repeat protein
LPAIERDQQRSRAIRLGAAGCFFSAVAGAAVVAVFAVMLLNMDLRFDFPFSDPCATTDDEFIRAARDGDTEAVRKSIDEGTDPNRSDGDTTALRCAVNGHQAEVVDALVDAGVRPNNSTFLSDAVLAGDVAIVSRLLDAGAKPSLEDLHFAAGDEGPMLLAPPNGARTPKRATPDEAGTIAELLLAHGADPRGLPNVPTPVLWASFLGRDQTLAVLLGHGADPNRGGPIERGLIEFVQQQTPTDKAGLLPPMHTTRIDDLPPLIVAAWQGNLEATRLLLDAGADPNAIADDAFTPLYAAAVWGHQDVVELLLDRGAEPSPPVRADVMSPAEVARAANRPDIAQLLESVTP